MLNEKVALLLLADADKQDGHHFFILHSLFLIQHFN